MSDGRLRFPRLNLARSKAAQLTINGTYDVNDDRKALLASLRKEADEVDLELSALSVTKYTTRGAARAVHAIGAAFIQAKQSPNDIDLVIDYRAQPDDALPRRSLGVHENEFLNLVQRMGELKRGSLRIRFSYDDLQASDLWFPLPIDLGGRSGPDIFEIRGIRGAKRATSHDGFEYSFILDRPGGEQVYLTVELEFEGSFTPKTPQTLFDRAQRASRDLIGSI